MLICCYLGPFLQGVTEAQKKLGVITKDSKDELFGHAPQHLDYSTGHFGLDNL